MASSLRVFLYLLLPLLSGLGGRFLVKEEVSEKGMKGIIPVGVLILASFLLHLDLPDLLFFSLFLVSALTDQETGMVYELPLYLLAPIALWKFYTRQSYVVAIFLLLLAAHRKSPKFQYYMGEGDLWLLLLLSMAYGRLVFYILVYAAVLGLIYGAVRRKREVWFAPFLFYGLLLSQFHEINKLFHIF